MAKIALGISVAVAVATSAYLGLFVYPLGEGPDERSHYDHAAFKFTRGLQTVRSHEGLYLPGKAPLGQAHQPPLYYWLGAGIYSLFLDRKDVAGFIEYRAGISHRDDGYFIGGASRCTWVHDRTRQQVVPELPKVQRALYAYRLFSSLLFGAAIVCSYVAVRLIAPHRPMLAASAAIHHAAIPSAAWRSGYINNDNLVVALCSISCVLALLYLGRPEKRMRRLATIMGMVAAAAFLTKYNGIAALGLCGLAILMKPAQRFRQKWSDGILMVAVFSILVAPDLWTNYRVDGDPLSIGVTIEVVPFLHIPTSYLSLLTNWAVWGELFRRFWINFHAFAKLDLAFPLWVFSVWHWVLLGITSSWAIFFVLPSSCRITTRRQMLFLLICVAGVLVTWLQFAHTFPIADGRYIHTGLVPFSVAAVLAIGSLAHLLGRFGDWIVPLASIVFAAFSYTVMLSFLPFLYRDCISTGEYFEPAGADMAVLDVNGDGQDELLFLHRVRHRLFVAERRKHGFAVVPEYTRAVPYSAHQLSSGDINGDGRANPLFWYYHIGGLGFVDGRNISQHDPAYGPLSYNAGPTEEAGFPELKEHRLLTGDLDQDGVDDLIFIPDGPNPTGRRQATVVYSERTSERYSYSTRRAVIPLPATSGEIGILSAGGRHMLATVNSGRLRLLRGDEEATAIRVPNLSHWRAVDFNGDGTSDLVMWNTGDRCAHAMLANTERGSLAFVRVRTQVCLPSKHARWNDALVVKSARQKEGAEQLVAFERRTGLVYLVSLDDEGGFDAEIFNPGWYPDDLLASNQ